MALEDEERRIAALRALAHPLRLQMLSLLTGAPMSAAELGRELGSSQALASYHLRRLSDAGLVELAEERSRRGGRERRYRVAPVDLDRRPPVPDDEGHALMLEAMIEQLRRRGAQRAPSPDLPDLTVDAELWVEPGDWARIRDAVAEAMVRLHDAARPSRQPGTVRVGVTALLFPMRASGIMPSPATPTEAPPPAATALEGS